MHINRKILADIRDLAPQMKEDRRFFHRHAESGWTEYITTAHLAERLTELGWEVHLGNEILKEDARLGLPSAEVLAMAEERALAHGVSPALMEKMAGGRTGLLAVLRGAEEGETVCLRFEIDANELTESDAEDHRPVQEGFASVHHGMMHACGHDGHMAIGLATAALLADKRDQLEGTVMLLFQPAEEGVRGASAVAASGILDNVDVLYGMHLGFALTDTGALGASTTGFLATTKLDARFTGAPAHAGARPDGGKNALLSAATAALQLHALPRRSAGMSRINVGTLHAGEGRNSIAAHAHMELEVRGATTDICRAMTSDTERVLNASAAMYDTKVAIETTGHACSFDCDESLAERTYAIAEKLGCFKRVYENVRFGASEDFTVLADRVRVCGGQANYLILGTQMPSGPHTERYDFDEDVLVLGITMMAALVLAD